MSTDSDATDGGWTICQKDDPLNTVSQYVYYLSRYGPTQLVQFGFQKPVTDIAADPFQNVKRVIFFVPGNPGAIAMYRHFLTRLHESLNIPVIGLSHAGMIREGISRFKAPLTVRKLVEHKLDFIENVIPEHVEIVLIGHSIGTFMSMQMMRLVSKRERFVHNVMLMPVLEKFTSCPGWKSLSFALHFRFLFYGLLLILSLMKDEIVLRVLPYLVPDLSKGRTPVCVYEGMLQLVDWRVVRNIFTLSRDESNQVQERDDLFIRQNAHKLSLLYCPDDNWVPLNLFRSLKRRFPDCHAELVDTVAHAFVMDKQMTEEVVTRVVKRLETLSPVA